MINKLAGFFKFQATNAETGQSRVLADWFPNLITDQGLNQIGIGVQIDRCVVGSSSTPPSFTDSSLASFVAATTNNIGNSTIMASSPPYYGANRRTYRFAMGAAAGNLSEVGMGWANNQLFSRALILDSGGNPTTITVLENEFLDVTYELRLYAPDTDEVGQFTLDGNLYDYTLRAARVTDPQYWGMFNGSQAAIFYDYGATCYSGDIGVVTSSPSGISHSALPGHFGYSNGSLTRSATASWGLTEANFGTGVRSLLLRGYMGSYQIRFTPVIPKDATRTLRLDFATSWARR